MSQAATAGPAARGGPLSLPLSALPGHPLIKFVLGFRLGERIARKALIGINGVLRETFIPLRRSPGEGDPGRGGGLADVLQDDPHVHGLGRQGGDRRAQG